MKTTKSLSIYLIAVLSSVLILNNSCNIKECCDNSNKIVGTGDTVNENLDLAKFNQIRIIGQATINVTKGDTQKVKLTAQQNILDVLTHEVSNNNFTLGTKENCSIETSKGILLDVVTPEAITKIDITGAADMKISGDKQEAFEISITGSGNIEATNLEVDNCIIDITGSGSCKVKVNKKLKVTISGSGSVVYIGNPQVDQTISGSGSVIRVTEN
jgi:hypothetical protein